MKYKGIIFDLDDTLYDYKNLNEKAIRFLCKDGAALLNVTKKQFEQAFRWGRDETKRILGDNPSARNRLIYMQHTLEYLDKFSCERALLLENIYWSYILEHMVPFEDVTDVLEYLKRKDVIVAICTDLTTEIQMKKIKTLGLEKYVDVLVTSEEVGVEKPEREMFECCLRKMRLEPKQVIMIGDNYEKDIAGAWQIGADAILYGKINKNVISICSYKEIKKFLLEKNEE